MNLTFATGRLGLGWILLFGLLAGTLVADVDEGDFFDPPIPAAGHGGATLDDSSSGQALPESEDPPIWIPSKDRSVVGGLSSYDLRLSVRPAPGGRVRPEGMEQARRRASRPDEQPIEPRYLQFHLPSNPHTHRTPPV
jgi:hypothetical protein